ncbi:hypothetical protein [Olsenella profusa]|uniref:Histone deacetylase n=1 Tax=Olsenella profusa TaxID=138595 RepID=A0ABS2F2B1_9ACTN|nr:hypothetical protein [Olsenella profusa]MBM6775020.1 hypothetical protein [Olsenella profusa]
MSLTRPSGASLSPELLARVDACRTTHVWYVGYGSNLLRARFMLYVEGGFCESNGRGYAGCDDPTPPVCDVPFDVPFDMYFGNVSEPWGGGVSFLDASRPGFAYGRAYLVTRAQFEQVWDQEGRGDAWYARGLDLGTYLGVPALSFTNAERRPFHEPGARYLDVLRRGLAEAYPELPAAEIERYLAQARGR